MMLPTLPLVKRWCIQGYTLIPKTRLYPMTFAIRNLSLKKPLIQQTTKDLSNRQKFKQLDPPLRLYERLERLGFGSLRRTKRYQAVRQQKSKDKHPIPDPEYKLPFLSFFAGAKTPASFPETHLEEVAFVGRSNVGKSSLLNSLASTTIVRTSDKPGLTQQINFFSVGRLFYMVDMPGYGFAFVDEQQRQQWRQLMETYISERKNLKRIYVVIDARHGLKLADLDFLNMLDRKRVKFQVVMTKCDLQVLPTLARRIMVVEKDIKKFHHAIQNVLVVSSKTGAGINQMRKEMLFITGHLKDNDYYETKSNQIKK
ncbi:P-loop containing nucleoside triphosphate hydrolase protein [Halteromyces radiatus]|uniref:P-loop containing nucleoside triphosphate hydrolase protein n=1 Tax=Halteromyces radiatus TaxID=101107 RepID=UPI0022206550|nr:P-loop containing nucleoside triphosphate hydrolase protein [Halteromyces radiatus]KAI8092690.1 P-loop containing nucleoside triphosphate hydrolase protein [Halteromyces radiatus]